MFEKVTPVDGLGQGNRNHRRAGRLCKGPGEMRRGSELVRTRGSMQKCEGPENPHSGCREERKRGVRDGPDSSETGSSDQAPESGRLPGQ